MGQVFFDILRGRKLENFSATIQNVHLMLAIHLQLTLNLISRDYTLLD